MPNAQSLIAIGVSSSVSMANEYEVSTSGRKAVLRDNAKYFLQKIPEELTIRMTSSPAKIIHSAVALRAVEPTRAIAAVWVAQVAIVFFTIDATPLAAGACRQMLGVSCA